MTDLGDLVPLGVQIRDALGVATNASSVTLTVTLPDGSTTSPFVANPPTITGSYVADYVPLVEGRYLVRWTTTGPVTAFTDAFDVRDLSKRSIISLAEAKTHINMDQAITRDDDEIRSMIETATSVVERHRDEVIARRTFVEADVAGSTNRLVLAHHPVISVTSIVDHAGVVDSVANWILDGQNGTLTRYAGGTVSYGTVVTYVAGYTQIPAHYVLAAKIIFAHLWQTQRLQTFGPQPTLGGQSRREDQIVTPSGLGFAIPHRAIELLGTRPSMIV